MHYVYRRTEPNLWTTGFYTSEGEWKPDTDHDSPGKAAERVRRLNSGDSHQLANLRRQVDELRRALALVIDDERKFVEFLHTGSGDYAVCNFCKSGHQDEYQIDHHPKCPIAQARAALARWGAGAEQEETK